MLNYCGWRFSCQFLYITRCRNPVQIYLIWRNQSYVLIDVCCNLIIITSLACSPYWYVRSRRVRSEEIPSWVTCRWLYVTVQWKWRLVSFVCYEQSDRSKRSWYWLSIFTAILQHTYWHICINKRNLIKIKPFTFSSLLICRGVGDVRKLNYGSHASDHISWIFNDMINTGYDLFDLSDCCQYVCCNIAVNMLNQYQVVKDTVF
jgi:hypothetical protein